MRKSLNTLAIATITGMMLIGINTIAQNVGINATGSLPNNSAGLDVNFNNRGLLIPRVALTSSTDAATILSPATSLLVYNTGTGGLTPAGYYYNAGTPASPNWVRLLITGTPSDAWLTLGNAGTTPGTHFVGTTDNVDLVFKTNNIERVRITNTGKVGINTAAPGSYYLDVLSNNSSIDGIRGQHTSGSTSAAFAAVTGSVNNVAYTTATGFLGYHNSNNITFGVYGNGGDLAGMFTGKVGINSVSTGITGYDLEVRNNVAANPSNVLLRATAQKPNINDILTNLDFGDNYTNTAQARIQILRDAAASSATDLPTAITFWTTADGTNTLTERMRILNNGNVGIGTTTPSTPLYIYAGRARVTLDDTPNSGTVWSITSGVNSGLEFDLGDGSVPSQAKMYISNPGFVGIGTTTPSSHLDVQDALSGIMSLNVSKNFNGISNTSAAFIGGTDAGYTNTGVYILQKDNIGFASVNTYLFNVVSNGVSKMVVNGAGNVGIGTTTPGGQFELSLDQGRKPSTNTWTIVSDERLKNIVGKYSKGLKEILQLNPVLYFYKNSDKRTFAEPVLKTQNVGFSAQEVQKVFPEAVGTDEDGYLNFNMHAILVAYTNAFKELHQLIEQQQKQIAELKTKIEQMEKR